jgi:glutaconate CoA-transferase subunit B
VSPGAAPDVVAFLARAAREFRRGGWVFTGFHWPVLAGELAARLDREEGQVRFAQLFEAGGVTVGPAGAALPTSTTDYAAFGSALTWRGSTTDVLSALVRRADRVVLDAANVDLAGRVNSSMIGPAERPRVRLPGGGGAADAAFAARELVLLHGGGDVRRVVAQVEHVTAEPGTPREVRLLTRWGTVLLGQHPRLVERVEGPDGERFREHLAGLGAEVADARPVVALSSDEERLAEAVLAEAAARGYSAARAALADAPGLA